MQRSLPLPAGINSLVMTGCPLSHNTHRGGHRGAEVELGRVRGERRSQLEKWALDRLNLVPTEGASQLVIFWGAALDTGATSVT